MDYGGGLENRFRLWRTWVRIPPPPFLAYMPTEICLRMKKVTDSQLARKRLSRR